LCELPAQANKKHEVLIIADKCVASGLFGDVALQAVSVNMQRLMRSIHEGFQAKMTDKPHEYCA
jgi:hypothetical protein